MNNPLVSIIVPCLNRAHFLKPTIDSILHQDYPNIECIIIDGGSTDGTIEILKSYGSKIKWVSEPDKGHADAINKGWKMSKGEILAWLNADDYYVTPAAVSTAIKYFQENPDTDLVYGDCITVSEDGKVIEENFKSRPWDLAYAVKYCHYTITQATSFIKRSILEKVNWLDLEFNYCKDHELWLRIGLVGKIKYIPKRLAYVRIGKGISQDREVSDAKVRLTKKFFTIKNLPFPFNSRKFRKRAISNAYLVGGHYALDGHNYNVFIRCLFKSFLTDPLNFPYILLYSLNNYLKVWMLYGWVPQKAKVSLRQILGLAKLKNFVKQKMNNNSY